MKLSPTLTRWLAAGRIMFNYVLADNARNKRSFAIGLATVYMVVTFLSLIQNALIRSGIVFVKMAEDQTGAFDFLALPDLSHGPTLLNYTAINQTLSNVSVVAGAAPRWVLRANVSSALANLTADSSLRSSATIMVMDSVLEESIGLATLWTHRPLAIGEVHVTSSLLRAIGVRPNAGDKIRISVDVFDTLQSASPAVVDSVLVSNATQAAAQPPLQLPLTGLTPQQIALIDPLIVGTNITRNGTTLTVPRDVAQNVILNQSPVEIECTVIDGISDPQGKYPPSIGNLVILDKVFAQSLFSADLSQFVTNPVARLLLQSPAVVAAPTAPVINLDDNAMSVLVLLRNRYELYTLPRSERKTQLILASNAVVLALGLDGSYSLSSVVALALEASYFIQVFLNEIFFTVVAVLVLLAAILITSLLLSDVEDKTFEYGMLRTLGMKQGNLILLVCLQSLFFSVPGVLVGLLSAYITFIPVGYFLSVFIGITADVSMDPIALALGVLAGLALPFVGMVMPIRRALTKTIRDALDVYHNVVFDTSLSIQRLEEWGLKMNEVVISVLLVVIGFIVYYLIPLSFIFGRLDLFFRMMTIILLGMVVGQVLLAQAIGGVVEKVAVMVTTAVCSDRGLTHIVTKNLAAHSGRNRKTAVMFTLCMGYILFVGTMFALQISSLNQNLEWFYGADISVKGPGMGKPLPEKKLRTFLDSKLTANSNGLMSIVESYSFASYPLNTFYAITSVTAGRLAPIRSPTVSVIAVEKNLLNVTKNVYAVASEQSRGFKFARTVDDSVDYVESLYRDVDLRVQAPPSPLSKQLVNSNFGTDNNASKIYSFPVPVLLSESMRDKGAIDAQNPVLIKFSYRISDAVVNVKTFFATPTAMMRKFPGFYQVSRLQTSNMPLFVSMDAYAMMLASIRADVLRKNITTTLGSPPNVAKGYCFIRLAPGSSALEVEALINGLNSLLEDDDFVTSNLHAEIEKTASTSSIIDIVFNIVALVGIVLSFFVLLLSFVANIRENSWEIGVIRAVGLNADKVTRVYIYEAVSIIIACMILGTILGIFTASTLTLQSNLFTEMPFTFQFPAGLFCLVILSALSLAVMGSYYPITDFMKRPIAITLRGG